MKYPFPLWWSTVSIIFYRFDEFSILFPWKYYWKYIHLTQIHRCINFKHILRINRPSPNAIMQTQNSYRSIIRGANKHINDSFAETKYFFREGYTHTYRGNKFFSPFAQHYIIQYTQKHNNKFWRRLMTVQK